MSINKKRTHEGHVHYAARRSPDDMNNAVKRKRALQWHIEFIIQSSKSLTEGLHDYNDKRYYFQRVKWEDADMLYAFDVPYVNADDVRVTFTMVNPQIIDNGNGTQSVTPGKTDTGGLARITKHLITRKAYKLIP